jgi:hypothetical protein
MAVATITDPNIAFSAKDTRSKSLKRLKTESPGILDFGAKSVDIACISWNPKNRRKRKAVFATSAKTTVDGAPF